MIDHPKTITSHQEFVEERSDIELENIRLKQELFAMQEQLQIILDEQRAAADTAYLAKESFLSMLSHELRTPLCAIIGWSRMLLSGKLTAAQTQQGLEIIDRSATAQSQLIENLVNSSRPNISRQPLRSIDPSNNSPDIWPTALPAPLQGLAILVVDDEADVRTIISTILEHYGATVTSIGSGWAALQELQANPQIYDVLLSDLGMPEMDGRELIKSVRALDVGGNIPAAALTAYNSPKEQHLSLLAGFQVHIAKPVEPEQLVAIVANLARKIEQ
jgi:CheY-like chemotaxis protein